MLVEGLFCICTELVLFACFLLKYMRCMIFNAQLESSLESDLETCCVTDNF